MSDKFAIDGTKIHYHLDRVAQWQTDPLNTFPIYVEIAPAGHCNHRCTFCAVDYIGYKTRLLDAKLLMDTLSDMAKSGVRSVMFAGEGEPLLHPELDSIINHAKSVGLDIGITTNGVALTKRFTDACLSSIEWIKVSMNGGPTSYASIHKAKKQDYERVWSNLEYAISRRRSSTAIGIQAVLLPENAQEMDLLASRARSSGLDYLVVKPYSQHNSSITTEYSSITYGGYEALLVELEQYSTTTFEVVARKRSMSAWDKGEHDFKICYSTPSMWAYCMADGSIYSCSAYLLDDRFNLGNIKDNSFSEIWLGEKRAKHLKWVREELDISTCRLNCRMSKVNQFLYDIQHPREHKNFI